MGTALAVQEWPGETETASQEEQSARPGRPLPALPDPDENLRSGDADSRFDLKSDTVMPEAVEPPRGYRFVALQQWEGSVLRVQERGFEASLLDMTNSGSPEEQADFDMELVTRDDKSLVMPGACFYLAVGYQTSPAGEVTRVTRLRFQRLPALTEKDLKRAERLADQWKSVLGESRTS